jgi:hypothetical protein
MDKCKRIIAASVLSWAATSACFASAEAPLTVAQGYGWQSQQAGNTTGSTTLDSPGGSLGGSLGGSNAQGGMTGSTIYAQLQQAAQAGQGSTSGITGLGSSGLGTSPAGGFGPDTSGLGSGQGNQFGLPQGMNGAGAGQFGVGQGTSGFGDNGLNGGGFGGTGFGGTGFGGTGLGATQLGSDQGTAGLGGTQSGFGQGTAGLGGTQYSAPDGNLSGTQYGLTPGTGIGGTQYGITPGTGLGGTQYGLTPSTGLEGVQYGTSAGPGFGPPQQGMGLDNSQFGASQGGLPVGIKGGLPAGMQGGNPGSFGQGTMAPDLGANAFPPSRDGKHTAYGATPNGTTPGDDDSDAATVPRQNTTAAIKEDTPIRRALADLHSHCYDQCVTKLDAILEQDPHNAQAHYMKGVAFVMTRHYSQAVSEYQSALKYSTNPEITRMAQAGLTKLGH